MSSVDMDKLNGVIARGNKFDSSGIGLYRDLWEFRIEGIEETLGRMEDCVKEKMDWGRDFTIDTQKRRIILKIQGKPPDLEEAWGNALIRLCHTNRHRFPSFQQWADKWREVKELVPIHHSDPRRYKLSIPLPLRGLLGALTVGVHLNVYTVKKKPGGGDQEVVDRIWVSHRAKGPNISYPGMLDQLVAGGVEFADVQSGYIVPCQTLFREASEEAGLFVDLGTVHLSNVLNIVGSDCTVYNTRRVFGTDKDGKVQLVGLANPVSAISFYDCKDHESKVDDSKIHGFKIHGFKAHDSEVHDSKDHDANERHLGPGVRIVNERHLEPGVRIVYDLKLINPGFVPRPQETGIERFESMTVSQVKQSLYDEEGRWKPNCGLVMLDFLVRHQLLPLNEHERDEVNRRLHRPLPFTPKPGGFFGWRGDLVKAFDGDTRAMENQG
ncbi:hypothetical protein NW762_000455 [Fusarium torreyae]|uniref:Nudix hydrolase domain-containing protein n=1 Tax=Fusarium torreyae TaxID=1237075 RepID=A0A9W8SH61_9HYPO|nr:hypothetical protein NW762_000455 [Fusarium torreyae]